MAYLICEHPTQELAELISQYIAKHLSDYKMPRYLFFVKTFPYTSRGKVIKNKLPEMNRLLIYQVS